MQSTSRLAHYSVIVCFMVALVASFLAEQLTSQAVLLIISGVYLYLIIKLKSCHFVIKCILQKFKYSVIHKINHKRIIQARNMNQTVGSEQKLNKINYRNNQIFSSRENSFTGLNEHSLNVSMSKQKKRKNEGEPLEYVFNRTISTSVNRNITRTNIQNSVKFLPRQYIDTKYDQRGLSKLISLYQATLQQYHLKHSQLQIQYLHIKRQFANYLKIHNQQQFQNIQALCLIIQKYFNAKIQIPSTTLKQSDYWLNISKTLNKEFQNHFKVNEILISEAIQKIINYVQKKGLIEPWAYKKGVNGNEVLNEVRQLVVTRKKFDKYLFDDSLVIGELRMIGLNKAVKTEINLNKKVDSRFDQLVDMQSENQQKKFLINFFCVYLQNINVRSSLRPRISKPFYQAKNQDYFLIYLAEGYQNGAPHYNIKFTDKSVQNIINCATGVNNFYSVVYLYLFVLVHKFQYDIKDKTNVKLRKIIQELLPAQSI